MNKKIAAVLLSALMACCTSASCSKSKSGSSENKSAAAPENMTVSSQSAETTAASTAVATEAVTKKTITTTKAKPITTTKPTEQPESTTVPADVSGSGYTDSISLATDFYQAYLDHNPEKIYAMFNEQEIECYKELMADELDGKSPDDVFSKDALIKALDDSMLMIEEIMAEFSDTENDRWTADVTEELFTEVTEEELSSFNEELGTDYTSGCVINYMYYINADNGEPFVGNSSAFLEKNGQWYVSFSSLMQSELINQIEL